jgi:hypothetical protein
MANHAKQFLEEDKATIESHLCSLSNNTDLIDNLLKSFNIPNDPKPQDVDQVMKNYSAKLKFLMVNVISNKNTQSNSGLLLDQVKFLAAANTSISDLISKEKSSYMSSHYEELKQAALDAGIDKDEITPLERSLLSSPGVFAKFQEAWMCLKG